MAGSAGDPTMFAALVLQVIIERALEDGLDSPVACYAIGPVSAERTRASKAPARWSRRETSDLSLRRRAATLALVGDRRLSA
jgi:hypothetical protein